jgi:hypothetical protein
LWTPPLQAANVLAQAYWQTGDSRYAHKAAVVLDRIADLYPGFDYARQGFGYNRHPSGGGYIQYWNIASGQTAGLGNAYDQIFRGMEGDQELVDFLSAKAQEYDSHRPKTSLADIRAHIEEGILLDGLRNPDKIVTNYPGRVLIPLSLRIILDWPNNRPEMMQEFSAIVHESTAVDGVTGEKGMTVYAAGTAGAIPGFLSTYDKLDDQFLPDLLADVPTLRDTFTFFPDMWCQQRYYPMVGDCGSGAFGERRYERLMGPVPTPSLAARLYELTGDPTPAQVLYLNQEGSWGNLNGEGVDPAELRDTLDAILAEHGPLPPPGDVNKEKWHIALLRSGEGFNERCLWIDYDEAGAHGQSDAMNIGLINRYLDVMPDNGYPPVEKGGWGNPWVGYHVSAAAHNTLLVDGQYGQRHGTAHAGYTSLWAPGEHFQALRVNAPAASERPSEAQPHGTRCDQYERTLALVDLSPEDYYVLDVFRVVGGHDHAKLQRTYFGDLTVTGIPLQPAPSYETVAETYMKNFSGNPSAAAGWSADWDIEDRRGYLPEDMDLHVRYTDLTTETEAYTFQSWVSIYGFGGNQVWPVENEDPWINGVMVRRRAEEAPLVSTFVAVMDPYVATPRLTSIRRLGLETRAGVAFPDTYVAVEMEDCSGRRDLIVCADPENAAALAPSWQTDRLVVQPDWDVRTTADTTFVRLSPDGRIERLSLCGGKYFRRGNLVVRLREAVGSYEIDFSSGAPVVLTGDPDNLLRVSGLD